MATSIPVQPRQLHQREEGFTLVELIVSLVVLAILMAIIAGTLSFSSQMMVQQRELNDGDQICETVRTYISDNVAYASDVAVVGGNQLYFKLDTATERCPQGAYCIYTKSTANGDRLYICTATKQGGSWSQVTGADAQDFELIPESTYIRGTQASCTFELAGNKLTVGTTVKNSNGDVVTQVDSNIALVNYKPV